MCLEERLIELTNQLERVKLRTARLERRQVVVVVTTAQELGSLADHSGRSSQECLGALKDAGGNMAEALAILMAH